jgi:hypothetical protein
MAAMRILIHASANDDRWFLCHGDNVSDVFVFHEPNAPSGGTPERIALAAFLARDEGSPQHQALLAMIGSLVASAHDPSVGSVDVPEAGAAGAEPSRGEEAAAI